MKLYLLPLLICCMMHVLATAQSKQVTLNGSLIVNGGETIPYRLVLTETNGEVKGYSLTYKEPNETKSTIHGRLDRRSHTLTFRETEITYSHGDHTGAYLCLIDARMENVHGAKGDVLRGPITSNEADKTACSTGTIVFNNEDEIQDLFGYHEKFDTVISMKKRVRDTTTAKSVPPPAPELPMTTDQVTAGIEKSYDWHADTVVIDVWDGGNVDGDRITLLFNSKPYLADYSLIKTKKQLRIPLSGHDINTISILAINEGTDPPNTASLLLTDGTIKYSVLAYNKKGQQSLIKIRRVK